MLTIACLSQKGGVGKSTFSRLIATAYAHADWQVKIADFNIKQKTSFDWAELRRQQGLEPAIAAETFTSVKTAMRDRHSYDILVCDGRPDSDISSLEIAREAHLIVVPAGLSADDLKPQVLFAHELRAKGVELSRIMFIFNRTVDSQVALEDARNYVEDAGYLSAKTDIPFRTSYQIAQNSGRSILETNIASLNERAARLAEEVMNALTMKVAA